MLDTPNVVLFCLCSSLFIVVFAAFVFYMDRHDTEENEHIEHRPK